MRTTIRLDDDLLRELKRYAADRGVTMTAVIDAALREKLLRRDDDAPAPPFRLVTAEGRLQPGVDLDDSAALLDLMEGT